MKYIPKDTYALIRKYVPILCVDMLIIDERGILLKRREHVPYKGNYSIIGGRVRKNEKIERAVKRHVKDDTGMKVTHSEFLDYYEYCKNEDFRQHAVSLIFKVEVNKCNPKSGKFFKQLPEDIDPPAKKVIERYLTLS